VRYLSPPRVERIAESVIRDPEQHTVMDRDGAVRSIQAADITMPEEALEEIWTPMHLERLARTYWRYLSRVTLGFVRVAYTSRERFVVLIAYPLVLLSFESPEYQMSAERGVVRWRIRKGLLVDRRGHEGDGYLEIDVIKCPTDEEGRAKIRVEVEIANFYPSLATWVARWFYSNTQSRIHVLVTHGFLRSLARLELEESAVGRFAVPSAEDAQADTHGRPDRITVGETPWAIIGGLVVLAFAAGVQVARWRLRRRGRFAQP
jgi:hypothetical protein